MICIYIYIKNWLKETKKARTHIISYTVHSYYVYICMQVSTKYIYISVYTNVHACMHACMQRMQYMCACVSTCRCIYLYLNVYLYVYSYLYSEIYVLLTELQSSFTNPQTWIKMVCREFPYINVATDFWRQCHLMSLTQIRITTIEDSQPTRPLPVVWFVWCESLWGSKRLRGDSPSHHHI